MIKIKLVSSPDTNRKIILVQPRDRASPNPFLRPAGAQRPTAAVDATPRKTKTLAPVRPALAVEVEYRKKLLRLIDAMQRSTAHWVAAAYRADPPHIAQDELPAAALSRRVRRLSADWRRRFDDLAADLAKFFARSIAQRSDVALRRSLERGGMAVRFTMTPAMRDVYRAVINENVSLIRSIPARYFQEIEGIVARSVATGRDLKQLSDDLQHQFGVVKRRAHLIARDQNNKAGASLQRARQLELGITQAVWIHSTAGKEPRPSHLKAGRDKIVFDLATGWYDPDEGKHILPGQLINCRCVSRPIVPGFS
jgi:uncharacterized protein with gpF-like domain